MSACVFEYACVCLSVCVYIQVYKYRTTKSHWQNEVCDSSADWMNIASKHRLGSSNHKVVAEGRF